MLGNVYRALDREVDRRTPLGFVGGEDSWDYPLFGEHRERRVVRMRREDVSYARMKADRLGGVVYFENAPPPADLNPVELGGEDYYLVRSRPG